MNIVKPHNVLDLKKDYAFKLYFKRDEGALISLLEHFLPLPKGSRIEDVEILDSELEPLVLNPEGKRFVLDLRVKIRRKEGAKLLATETVNVEMQSTGQNYFTERLLAYASRLYLGQIKPNQKYDRLYPVYSLAFCSENLKEFASITDEYYHLCTIRREDSVPSRQSLFSKGIQFVVVELKKFSKTTAKELVDFRENWCYILKNGPHISESEFETIRSKGKKMGDAVKRLWNLSEEERVQMYMEDIENQRRDQWAREDYARDRGREEGLKKGREEVARQMIAKGMDISTICECTGLSEKEVKALKSKKK